jgi:hypothetical protein
MTNTLMSALIPAEFIAVVIVFVLHNRLPRIAMIVLGVLFAVVGAGALALTEMEYTTANTQLSDRPIDLSHPSKVVIDVQPVLSGFYEMALETDHSASIVKFGCLTGDSGFEARCPKGDPELDLTWTVSEPGGVVIARGGSDRDAWRTAQAAIAPADAVRQRAAYIADMAKIENPSDVTPLYHELGIFHAERGRHYDIAYSLNRPAPTLAAMHPRLLFFFSGVQTKGLGLLVILFCLIGVIGGGGMILISRQA